MGCVCKLTTPCFVGDMLAASDVTDLRRSKKILTPGASLMLLCRSAKVCTSALMCADMASTDGKHSWQQTKFRKAPE